MHFHRQELQFKAEHRHLVFGIAAEEFGHGEMRDVMIAQLLEKQPLGVSEPAQQDRTVAAVIGGMDREQAIAVGAGARPVDSNSNPWTGGYITERQPHGRLPRQRQRQRQPEMPGPLQVCRLIHTTAMEEAASRVQDVLNTE